MPPSIAIDRRMHKQQFLSFRDHISTPGRRLAACLLPVQAARPCFHPRRHVGARRRDHRDGAHPIMSESFLAAAAERTAEAESDLVELKRGTWATDRVG